MKLFYVALAFFFAPLVIGMSHLVEESNKTRDITAFNELMLLIHRKDQSAVYDYLESVLPKSGWPYVLNNFRSRSGLTLLQRALLQSPRPSFSMVSVLLHYGADPNIPIKDKIDRHSFGQGQFYPGWTTAHILARASVDGKIRDLLYAYGCNFYQGDFENWTHFDVVEHDIIKKFKKKKRKSGSRLSVVFAGKLKVSSRRR